MIRNDDILILNGGDPFKNYNGTLIPIPMLCNQYYNQSTLLVAIFAHANFRALRSKTRSTYLSSVQN